jgi:hypothetical protein
MPCNPTTPATKAQADGADIAHEQARRRSVEGEKAPAQAASARAEIARSGMCPPAMPATQ